MGLGFMTPEISCGEVSPDFSSVSSLLALVPVDRQNRENPGGVEGPVVARKQRRVRGNPSNRGINRLSLALRFCADPDPKVTSCPSRGGADGQKRSGQLS